MSTLYSEEAFSLKSSGKYLVARFSRIAPAYWIAVIFAWLIYINIPDFHYQMTPVMTLRSMFFGGSEGVFWSIPPEIQFYVFFIGLWFSWQKFRQGNPYWLMLIGAVCLAFIATRTMWGGLTLPSKMHIFLYGFLAAFLVKLPAAKKIMCNWQFQIGITLAAIAYGTMFITKHNIYSDLAFPLLVALSIASMATSTVLTRPLETNAMRLVGAASFSIYLFHDSILFLMRDLGLFDHFSMVPNIALTTIISLAIPVAFHFMAEKRLNKFAKAKGLTVLDRITQCWDDYRLKKS